MDDQSVEFRMSRKSCEPCRVSVNLPGRLHALIDGSVPVSKDPTKDQLATEDYPVLLRTDYVERATIRCCCGNTCTFTVGGQKRKVYNEYCPHCGMKIYLNLGRRALTVEQVGQPNGKRSTACFEPHSGVTNDHLHEVQQALVSGVAAIESEPRERDIVQIHVDYDNKQVGIDFSDGAHMGLVCHPRNNRRYRAMQKRREEKHKVKES